MSRYFVGCTIIEKKCLLEKKDFVKEKLKAERKVYLYRHNSVNIL